MEDRAGDLQHPAAMTELTLHPKPRARYTVAKGPAAGSPTDEGSPQPIIWLHNVSSEK